MPNLNFAEMCSRKVRQGLLLLVLWGLSCAFDASLRAQNSGSTGTLSGKVTDADDKLPLIGVNVVIKGSSLGSSSNLDGLYSIARIPAGQYQVEVSYLGYEKKIYTGVRIEGGKAASLNIVLRRSAVTMDQEVVVVGDKPLIDLEQTKTEQRVGQESIEAAPTRSVQSVLNTQAGVMLNPEGLSIRGGRTYETAFMIDGASATDPLAGTGFGIDLGTNSIDRMDIATGGGDVTQGMVRRVSCAPRPVRGGIAGLIPWQLVQTSWALTMLGRQFGIIKWWKAPWAVASKGCSPNR
ncbi:MAG: hypothetical protein EBQ67_08755 [Sphingobacteriia bacterium]|nr:hypothetical protein [Sphingobacteriia bacterium]